MYADVFWDLKLHNFWWGALARAYKLHIYIFCRYIWGVLLPPPSHIKELATILLKTVLFITNRPTWYKSDNDRKRIGYLCLYVAQLRSIGKTAWHGSYGKINSGKGTILIQWSDYWNPSTFQPSQIGGGRTGYKHDKELKKMLPSPSSCSKRTGGVDLREIGGKEAPHKRYLYLSNHYTHYVIR